MHENLLKHLRRIFFNKVILSNIRRIINTFFEIYAKKIFLHIKNRRSIKAAAGE